MNAMDFPSGDHAGKLIWSAGLRWTSSDGRGVEDGKSAIHQLLSPMRQPGQLQLYLQPPRPARKAPHQCEGLSGFIQNFHLTANHRRSLYGKRHARRRTAVAEILGTGELRTPLSNSASLSRYRQPASFARYLPPHLYL